MKKILTLLALIFFAALIFAQAPQKMTYQAVVRDSDGLLVTSKTVGLQLTILQGAPGGTEVYSETQSPTTNANGLLTVEIGGGTGFDAIDWTAGPYFLKTGIDPAGGSNYTAIEGTSQLLSVPYALHAHTAENITGTVPETDPLFIGSVAAGITSVDTAYWNDKLDSFTESDPVFGASVAAGITETDTAYWNGKLDSYTEADPVFGASVAAGIASTDTTYWNDKMDIAPGTVLQVVVRTSDSTSSLNVTTFTEADEDYRINIVPMRPNSIFLVEFSFSINTAVSPNTVFHMQLIRDIGGTGIPIGIGPAKGNRNRTSYVSRPNNGTDGNDQQNVYMIAKDSGLDVGTTYTYGFKYRRENAGAGTTYFNYSNGDSSVYGFSGIMTMKVTEIAQ